MKIFTVILIFFSLLVLSGCGLRERLLAPPDEVTIPEGSSEAICIKDDVTYRYIYQADGIYAFYIDDELQDESRMNTEQEQAFLHGESVINYLNTEYNNTCTITDYTKTSLD
jgi:predicted small lipoprotein YifL